MENILKDYNEVVAQRNEIRERMSDGLKRLNSVKFKQRAVFDELLYRYNELSDEHDAEQKQLAVVVEDNDRLRRENELLDERMDDRMADAQRLETTRLTLSERVQKSRKQLEVANAIAASLRDEQQRAESELRYRDQKLVSLGTELIENATEQTMLEQQLNEIRNRNGELRSLVNATRTEYVNIVGRLRAECTELQCQLTEKSSESSDDSRCLDEKQDKLETIRERTKRLRTAITKLREKNRKEKVAVHRNIVQLRDQVESATCDLVSANGRVCNAQVGPENNMSVIQTRPAAGEDGKGFVSLDILFNIDLN